MDLAGPGLTLLTGPDNGRWIAEASRLGLRQATVSHREWLAEVCLPADGALLLRPDVIVAWHSASRTPLAEALTRVLATAAIPYDRRWAPAGGFDVLRGHDPVVQVARLDGRGRE